MGSWLLFCILSSLVDSLSFTFCKSSLNSLDPLIVLCIRFSVMTLILIGLSFSLNKFSGISMSALTMRPWVMVYITGILSAISYILYFLALKYGFASKVSALDSLNYIFILAISALFLKEAITTRMVIGTSLIALGAYLSM